MDKLFIFLRLLLDFFSHRAHKIYCETANPPRATMCRGPNALIGGPTAPTPAPEPEHPKVLVPTHSAKERNTEYDILFFLAPALFCSITPVLPIFVIGILRVISTHLTLSLHYIFVDKDNYNTKISQKQLKREKDDYLVGCVLHMWTQVALQIVFPGMFFSDSAAIGTCAVKTFLCHVFFVEPLYYAVHRWLHVPRQMKHMHGFHHLSINTTPSTSLVQNFEEHFVYIATFGPAFFVPFFTGGHQHWAVIGAYLLSFDLVNAFGHMNIRIRHWSFTNRFSPLRYLFYTPEMHLGHHAYFNANYSLFMPLWDHLFGTYREYKKSDVPFLLPAKQQDFVFVGHSLGLGHLLTCPEFSIYNVYESYYRRTFWPIEMEFGIMRFMCLFTRLFTTSYSHSRYLVQQKYIGRVVCILRTPLDYFSPKSYDAINRDIVRLIREENARCGTTCFGLGNLNKMKQVNDGGSVLVDLIKQDPVLKDQNIRIWTGDTMTAASVYQQIMDMPDLQEFFFIGANGRVGTAVCQMLLKTRPKLQIRVYSTFQASMDLPNVSYASDMKEIVDYKVVVVGEYHNGRLYAKAFEGRSNSDCKTQFILDYTVPFIPINVKNCTEIKHIQIGLLQIADTSSKAFLKGPFDVSMSHDQNHIYPCHAGCIVNLTDHRDTSEVGEIILEEINTVWKKAVSYGLANRAINCK
jgi:sterol desaturase/sphingolipid hydroxylase (fatty acid hydroxylase superfamily)